MKRIRLNDGNEIPAIGFGTFQIPADGSTYEAVKVALSLGVRHIDTAVAYFNEHEVDEKAWVFVLYGNFGWSLLTVGYKISGNSLLVVKYNYEYDDV